MAAAARLIAAAAIKPFAELITDIATGEVEDMPDDAAKDPAAVELDERWPQGREGKAAKMTPRSAASQPSVRACSVGRKSPSFLRPAG